MALGSKRLDTPVLNKREPVLKILNLNTESAVIEQNLIASLGYVLKKDTLWDFLCLAVLASSSNFKLLKKLKNKKFLPDSNMLASPKAGRVNRLTIFRQSGIKIEKMTIRKNCGQKSFSFLVLLAGNHLVHVNKLV